MFPLCQTPRCGQKPIFVGCQKRFCFTHSTHEIIYYESKKRGPRFSHVEYACSECKSKINKAKEKKLSKMLKIPLAILGFTIFGSIMVKAFVDDKTKGDDTNGLVQC